MSFGDVIRREFKSSDDERDNGLTTPEEVERYDNIYYVKDNDKWHLLDVYRPKSAGDKRLPVIVNVHGGGWVYGDKDVYQYYCMDLCRRGYAVVNYSYRLAPENKYPAQLEDTIRAFEWVGNNADEYGFDLDNLYAVGDSAGANILGLYCIICTNEEYASLYNFKVPEIKGLIGNAHSDDVNNMTKKSDIRVNIIMPKAVGLNCGAYDLSANSRELKGFMKELMPDKGTPEELEMLNVTGYINKDFPPAFLMTCYGDFLMNQAPLLEASLKEHGIAYVSKVYGSEEEPLKHVFHCDIRMKEAKICNDETCEFFERI